MKVYIDGNVLFALAVLEDKLHEPTVEMIEEATKRDWELIVGTPILLELEQLLYLGDMGWLRLRAALGALEKYGVKVVEDNHEEVLALANEYLDEDILSERYFAKLLVIASAVKAEADYLVSWDTRRVANKSIEASVNEINLRKRLKTLQMVSPRRLLQIMKEGE